MTKHIDAPINLEGTVSDLTLAIGQLLRRLRQEVDHAGLTWSQSSALARLDREGAMTTAELARLESVKPQSMGATLADLEQDGLIERQPHPSDGRQILLLLTDKGREVRRQRNIAKQQWLLAGISRLAPDEQQTLIAATALLKRLGDV
ncbi:DNA-binding MarR family transcriptional regulator [Herbaspirillum sp. Sphag1AN]|uniref:MarR family winged helix-turn-helix transcriptional regulator n=1 Tax=unclassified Herbaspirillum TaxID=2624150 RepID=UPI00160FD2AE|nr:MULTISPECIES: MarR family transcriptional regulator [unclassified Herbaspirillum]MBB3213245.1 DNA-binding MarR family transcriptional regulator [Herbaspirillum sp. Sphag1AN]MBB3246442.1 DNA-binding MarR family transcriptional regulator [Herbaspirillum sp. Sphag64]